MTPAAPAGTGSIRLRAEGGRRVLHLSGRIDAAAVARFEPARDELGGPVTVVDMSEVTSLDGEGLRFVRAICARSALRSSP